MHRIKVTPLLLNKGKNPSEPTEDRHKGEHSLATRRRFWWEGTIPPAPTDFLGHPKQIPQLTSETGSELNKTKLCTTPLWEQRSWHFSSLRGVQILVSRANAKMNHESSTLLRLCSWKQKANEVLKHHGFFPLDKTKSKEDPNLDCTLCREIPFQGY